MSYYIAKGKVAIGQGNKAVNVLTSDGSRANIMAKLIVENPAVLANNERFFGIIWDAIYMTLGAMLCLAILVGVYFKYTGRRLGGISHIRGGSIATARYLKRAILRDNRKQRAVSYNIAGIPYPAYAENQHTFITGSPGSGKTNTIAELIAQIMARGDRAIIYDKTGSYIKWFYDGHKDVILNPLDARSASWSVFNEVRNETDFDTMAEALIPTEKGAVDPFWFRAARTLFSSVCTVLYKQGVRDNLTLLTKLLITDIPQLAQLVKGTPAQSLIDKDSPKMALSVMAMLVANVGAIKHLKDSGKPFSIRKWIMDEDNSNFLFVTSRADQHASLMPLISTWLEIAINSLLSLGQSRKRKIWIILDELPSLHFLPSLQAGLAESRQFGGAFVLSLQVMPQLQAIYGHDIARSTSGLCQTRLVFKSSDADTARSGADSLGGSETEEFKEGFSYGVSEARDGINTSTSRSINNLILPTQVMNLPNLQAYIRVGMDYPVAKLEVPYIERKEIAERFVPLDTGIQEENTGGGTVLPIETSPVYKEGRHVRHGKIITSAETPILTENAINALNAANSNEELTRIIENNRFNEEKSSPELLLDH